MKFHPGARWSSHKACMQFGWCTTAYWDVLVFADHEEVRCNRVDAQIANNKTKQVSCPWVNNSWEKKSKKKTVKYAPLHWELKTASVPCLQIETTRHHHWCTRRVVTGDGHYNVQDCGEHRVRKYTKFGECYAKLVQMTPLRLQRESLRL